MSVKSMGKADEGNSTRQAKHADVPHATARKVQQGPSMIRRASNFVRNAPGYLSLATAGSGIRFNAHVRRVGSFARKSLYYASIEPLSYAMALLIVYFLYNRGTIQRIPFLIMATYLIAQVLMVAISFLILGFHLVQSWVKNKTTGHVHGDDTTTNAPRGKLVHLRGLVDARDTQKTSKNASSSSTGEGEDDDDVRAPPPTGRCGICVIPAVPQVVRWDIVGVTLSNWFGKVNSIPLPVIIREPLYKLYAKQTGANLSEVKMPLRSFRNLQEFFSRELKDGLRPIAPTPIVSPVDGKIVVLGPVTSNYVEQVKGVTYPLSCFLGDDIYGKIKDKSLWHCVIYLAPGDYHRIHSSADWTIETLRHFPGTLFPISPVVARLVPNLFALNERVVLAGRWQHGFYSATAVGAYHVGSMAFNFDKTVRTNKLRRDFRNPNLSLMTSRNLGAYAYDFTYPSIPFTRVRPLYPSLIHHFLSLSHSLIPLSLFIPSPIPPLSFVSSFSFNCLLCYLHTFSLLHFPLDCLQGQELGTFKLGSTIVLVFEAPTNSTFRFLVKPGDKVKMGQAFGTFN